MNLVTNKLKNDWLVLIYLFAIVISNLLVLYFGPSFSVLNAFLFIGLDITTRDFLHEKWVTNRFVKMLALVLTGSVLSYVINNDSYNIAAASFIAFFLAGMVDYFVYSRMGRFSKTIKINTSNVFSSLVDSIVFPAIAFGFPLMYGIMLMQFLAKISGGYFWSKMLNDVHVTTKNSNSKK